MQQLILVIIAFTLTGCSVNQGFPKEISGSLKAINTQEVINNVK